MAEISARPEACSVTMQARIVPVESTSAEANAYQVFSCVLDRAGARRLRIRDGYNMLRTVGIIGNLGRIASFRKIWGQTAIAVDDFPALLRDARKSWPSPILVDRIIAFRDNDEP
jgi:hypothetical protein